MKNTMKVLLTGATGFLGEYLLVELISRGHTVYGLYRNERKKMKTESFLKSLGYSLPPDRLHWLEGDVLDICDCWDDWEQTCPALVEVDNVLHSAASLRFNLNEAGDPMRTNVGSAQALRQLLDRKPIKVHLMSTAFVCGLVRGRVLSEVIHPRGDFVNAYEQSKWEAEQIWGAQATILRPGIIVGHSQTGRCTSFTGWYVIAKAAYLLDRLLTSSPNTNRYALQIKAPTDPTATENIVPVDYVAKAAISIIENPDNHNRIFHLTHPTPHTHKWMHDILSRRFNFGGVQFTGPDAPFEQPTNEIQRMIWGQTQAMLLYLSNNPIFDRTNTDRATPDLEVPPITETLIDRLIDYAIAVNWGQARQ